MGKQALTKDMIRDRIRTRSASLTNSLADLFANPVDEGVQRNIIAIYLFGDATSTRVVDLAYVNERTDTVFDDIPVSPTEKVALPEGSPDLETPIIILNGGENLQGVQDDGSGVTITLVYWDTESFSTGQ